jgi:hypothetical protein
MERTRVNIFKFFINFVSLYVHEPMYISYFPYQKTSSAVEIEMFVLV